MLRDDDMMTSVDDRDVSDVGEAHGVIKHSNPFKEGIVHVMSMRGLVRAVASLRRSSKDADGEFERALVKMINLNGAMARAIEDGRK